MTTADLVKERTQKPCCDLIYTRIVISITWEISLNLEIFCDSFFITDDLNFCIFDCTEGIYNMRESCNTGCERTLAVIIDERHLSSLIIIFIMHVMDQVQYIHINVSQPVHPPVEFLDYFVVICIFGGDTLHLRSALNAVFFIKTAVECIQQCFCKICTSTEKLNLFPCLCCRNTAADGIVVSPLWFHNFVILVLDRTCIN